MSGVEFLLLGWVKKAQTLSFFTRDCSHIHSSYSTLSRPVYDEREKWPKNMGYYFCFETKSKDSAAAAVLNVKSQIIIFLLNSSGQEE